MNAHTCSLCPTWRSTPGQCLQVACRACGTIQCFSNGTARGCCRHCSYGRLPGWSFLYCPSVCTVKGCTQSVVYSFLPGGKKHTCKEHGDAILARRTARQNQQQRGTP